MKMVAMHLDVTRVCFGVVCTSNWIDYSLVRSLLLRFSKTYRHDNMIVGLLSVEIVWRGLVYCKETADWRLLCSCIVSCVCE